MPIVEVKRSLLMQKLGKDYTKEEFADLCFDFGIELDEVTSQYLQILHEKANQVKDAKEKAKQNQANKPTKSKKKDKNAIDLEEVYKILHKKGGQLPDKTKKKLHDAIPELKDADTDELYKIDVPANRYDLLCIEGLTRALLIFDNSNPNQIKHPNYTLINKDNDNICINVKTSNCNQIRPYIVGAILRNIKFTQESFDSFIKLQEKLHFNICRKRTLVAIGTHDLDTLKPPFLYDARAPDQIKFKALRENKEMTAKELLEWYEDEQKNPLCPVKEYVYIIKDSPVYPVIYDSAGVVLSMPPIINGSHSKVTLNTRNIFIESTATDLTKASIVLNTIVSMFSEYCSPQFNIETVSVKYEQHLTTPIKSYITPCFSLSLDSLYKSCISQDIHLFSTSINYINCNLGTTLSGDDICSYLYRMGLNASSITCKDDDDDDDKILVICPPTRSDIMHQIDIVEDVAIAFGYNNIIKRLPNSISATIGSEFILNTISDKIRRLVSSCGYCEVLNWVLISKKENFDNMLIPIDNIKKKQMVQLNHPKATQFEICRTNLLPGIFKTLSANIGHKNVSLPLYLFECGDVILCDNKYCVASRNERRLAAIIVNNKNSGLQYIHGLMDRIMQQNNIIFEEEKKYIKDKDKNIIKNKRWYKIQPSSKPSFLPKRQAVILVDNKPVGYFGIIHPKVLKNFGIIIGTPILVSALEINIECFVKQ